MSTFLELQDEVLAHGFDATRYRTRVQKWLNDANAYLARRVRGAAEQATFTVSLVAGTDTYALPADMARLERAHIAGVPLSSMTDRDFDLSNATARGVPSGYFLEGSNLRVRPVPSAAATLTLRYWKLPATMASDAATPVVPSDMDDALVAYALHHAYRTEDDFEAAAFWHAEWQRAVAAADSELSSREARIKRVGDERPDLAGASRPRFVRP